MLYKFFGGIACLFKWHKWSDNVYVYPDQCRMQQYCIRCGLAQPFNVVRHVWEYDKKIQSISDSRICSRCKRKEIKKKCYLCEGKGIVEHDEPNPCLGCSPTNCGGCSNYGWMPVTNSVKCEDCSGTGYNWTPTSEDNKI